jgi:hypothetical protein
MGEFIILLRFQQKSESLVNIYAAGRALLNKQKMIMYFTFESFSIKYLHEQYKGHSMTENVITNTFLILAASPSCHYNDHDNEGHQMPEQRRPEPQVFNIHLLLSLV